MGGWGLSLLPLLGLAALAGLVAAWLTVLLLVFRGRPEWHLQGLLNRRADSLAAFANSHLVPLLPSPARFFEQLGPDRFRREYFRHLRLRIDADVDEVMDRRNAGAWGGLSAYARTRIYSHVQKRLPYAVDNFVEQVHRNLDSLVNPRALVHRYLTGAPGHTGQLFLSAFGADLRARLPLAALLGGVAGVLPAALLAGQFQLAWTLGVAALSGSTLMLALLAWPSRPRAVWPLRAEGILFRRRHRFLRALARRLANEPLSWPALAAEITQGGQSSRVRHILRREVSGILDTTVFKATLQWLVGPEAVLEVKHSAQEKALEVLARTPVSVALKESCREEIERSLLFAADQDHMVAYATLWRELLADAWRWLPPALAGTGFLSGWLLGMLLHAG